MGTAPISVEDVVAFLHRFEAAAGEQDFSKVAGMIHDDAVFLFTDGDFVGLEAIRDVFEKTWESGANASGERYYLSGIRVLTADTESASATYTFNWEYSRNGQDHLIQGRGTRVLIREGDRLQIIHEHLSRVS